MPCNSDHMKQTPGDGEGRLATQRRVDAMNAKEREALIASARARLTKEELRVLGL